MQVIISKRAEKNIESIAAYLAENFGVKAAYHFVGTFEKALDLLCNFPELGKMEHHPIRAFILSKHLKLFYIIREEKLIVLSIFDVRQNPGKAL